MRAEIVAVGTELLLGQVVDTNSAWLARRLAEEGVDCLRQTRVGDNPARIARAVTEAASRAGAVLVCGGLGPTADDVTRPGLALALGQPLEDDPAMAELVTGRYARRGVAMPGASLVQAQRPRGSRFIDPTTGTAPGLRAELASPGGRSAVVYALPGVPSELEEMFDRAVAPELRRVGGGGVIRSRVLRTWGLGESAVAERVASRVEAQTNPTIAFLATGTDGVWVRVTARAADEPTAEALLDGEERALRACLGPVVYGVDGATMGEAVGALAQARGLTVGVAESLTGGLVGALLSAPAGASAWFRGSVVAYAAEVKRDLLAVASPGVVSAEAAASLARGAAALLGADVGLAVTGVAGPTRQEGVAVGTVYAAVALGPDVDADEVHLGGDRLRVRHGAAMTVLDRARLRLARSPSW